MFTILNTKRKEFNAWVATWLPGWKTKIVASLGLVGTVAASTQEMLTGVPLSEIIEPMYVALINGGLYILAYYFKSLSKNT